MTSFPTDSLAPDCAASEVLQGIEHAIDAGISLIQLRQTQLDIQDYEALCEQVLQRFGARATFMFKGDQPPADRRAGWHLTSRQLRKRCGQPEPVRPLSAERWLSASCHDAEELQMAERLGVDFAVLSPLLPTASHPEASPLGWEQAHAMLNNCRLPVYLLGGLTGGDLPAASRKAARTRHVASLRE